MYMSICIYGIIDFKFARIQNPAQKFSLTPSQLLIPPPAPPLRGAGSGDFIPRLSSNTPSFSCTI